MQVYLIPTDGERFLIVKKRVTNSWWGGKDEGKQTIVNQAGQYAAVGGQVNQNETATDAAFREFGEVGGKRIGFNDGTKVVLDASKEKYPFQALTVLMKPVELETLLAKVSENVKPNMSGKAPSGMKVMDLEWQEALLVKKASLGDFLGKYQPFKGQDYVQKNAKPYSQALDWYARIAKALQAG